MTKVVHDMKRREYLTFREHAVGGLCQAVLDEYLYQGAEPEEIEELRPSLQAVLGSWWDRHNLRSGLGEGWTALPAWLRMLL